VPIIDDLNALAGRAHRDLDAMHDFFAHSGEVWYLFNTSVAEGRTLTFTNSATGTTANQDDLVRLSNRYLDEYPAAFTFQRFVSIFETFVFDLLRLLLAHNPRRLGKKQVAFEAVLAAPGREAIILAVIDKELNELKYERLRAWFEYLEATIHLGCPTAEEVEARAEIKASRDVLEHNAGVANAIYVAKSGGRARHAAGEPIEVTDAYHRESWSLIQKVVRDVSAAAVARLSAPPAP
jgi:hypothetical protein